MSSVSNTNFPCIVKLDQLNKKNSKIEYVLKEKKHKRSLSIKRITSRKSFYFCLQQMRTDVLGSICMCQEMAKLHLGHSIYHLLCAVSMQFFSRALKYIMKYISNCSGQLLLLPSGWDIEHVIIFWVGLKKN